MKFQRIVFGSALSFYDLHESCATDSHFLRGNLQKDDEEFGGVLGNNYLNQYLDDCMAGGVLSDYDSDSD